MYTPTELIDCVMRIETNLGVALEQVRVGEIEDECGGSYGTVLRGVGGGDVGLEGQEIFILDSGGGCHTDVMLVMSL
jgi:hypothetical protein